MAMNPLSSAANLDSLSSLKERSSISCQIPRSLVGTDDMPTFAYRSSQVSVTERLVHGLYGLGKGAE